MSRAAAEVGSTANSYQILAKLAAGGMAEIFLARGEGVAGVERYCVLKRILRERASDVHFVRMFLDEARLAAQLQHPNIAQVYDIGKLGDSYFFTMEYVHGETVRALLHRSLGLRRKLPIPSVLTIVAGAAAGLHHAHVRVGLDGRALGIVHRDVSPSNLMVSYEGGVKLVDFGVAKAADRAHETKSGTVKGKISYLSPEQCRGKRVDRRSDLFSLGICFWEMLTTERLYRRDSDFENMNAIVSEPPPPPSSRRADIPAEIDELVLRLLAKDPDERCQSADELVETVEAVAARTGAAVSGSALGRFMRELFGQRPEPWLELESLQEHGDVITVTGEPIPSELALPPADRVAQQLSSVLDLSPQRSISESIDEVRSGAQPGRKVSEPTAQIGKRAKRGFPLAAPPPTSPGVSAAASSARAGSAAHPSPAVPLPPGAAAPFVRVETLDLDAAVPLPPGASSSARAGSAAHPSPAVPLPPGAAAPFVRVETLDLEAAAPSGARARAPFVRVETLDLDAAVPLPPGAAAPFVRVETLDLDAAARSSAPAPFVRVPTLDLDAALAAQPSAASPFVRVPTLDLDAALAAQPSAASPFVRTSTLDLDAALAAQPSAASPFVRVPTLDLDAALAAQPSAASPFVRVPTLDLDAALAAQPSAASPFVRTPTLDLEAALAAQPSAASPFVRTPPPDIREARRSSSFARGQPLDDFSSSSAIALPAPPQVSPPSREPAAPGSSASFAAQRTAAPGTSASHAAQRTAAPGTSASHVAQGSAAPGTSASFAAAPFAGQGSTSGISAPFVGTGPASAVSDAAAAFAAQGSVAPASSASFAAQGAAPAASSGAFAASPSSGPHVTSSGAFAASPSSGPHVASSGAFAALPAARAALRSGPRRRAAWPLYAVIAAAAVLGSGAMILMMRMGSEGSGAVAIHATASEVAAPAQAAEHRSAPIVEPIDLPSPPAPPAGAPSDTPDPAAGAGAIAPAEPVGASNASATSPPARTSATLRGGAASPVPRAGGPPRTVPRSGSAAAHAPERRDARAEDIPRHYADGHYDKVVALCGGGPVSADHAPTCFLAACHVGDPAAARRLLAAAPAARRDPLIAGCKQLGVDLQKADCEADPMSCQH